MAVELNILIRIEIKESPFLSDGLRLAVDEDELSLRDNCLVWMKIEFRDRSSIIGFISFSNYPTRLKFELDEDSGLDVLKVATRRASLGG